MPVLHLAPNHHVPLTDCGLKSRGIGVKLIASFANDSVSFIQKFPRLLPVTDAGTPANMNLIGHYICAGGALRSVPVAPTWRAAVMN